MDTIRARGHLICASVQPLAGFAQRSEDGFWSGFDVDFCRAVATAVFGDPNLVEFRPLQGESRFAQLQTGAVDLIARNSPWTMRRDTGFGASYVGTSFVDGQAFLVPQSLGVVSAFNLQDVAVCVVNDAEQLANLSEFFFSTQASYQEVLYDDDLDLGHAYSAGLCNVVTGSATFLHAIRRQLPDPAAHRILPERISKEMLGPVVREGDDQWFNVVRWTLFALINAEEMGVTSLNLEQMAEVRTPAIRRLLGLDADFGTPLGLRPDWMRNVIRAVGNYGELFDRNFGPQTGAAFLRGQNSLWTAGGLIVAPPIR